MKSLEFNQMENLQGGLTNRDCMIRGAVAALALFTPFAAVSIGIIAMSGDCYTF